jgi:hypothetical protein
MKRLAKYDDIYHAESVFNPKWCVDFDGNTYEYLPPESYREDLDPKIKYRVVFGYDDYDYVSPGDNYTLSEGTTLNQRLDAKRAMVWVVSRLRRKQLPVGEWLSTIVSQNISVVHLLTDLNQLVLDICYGSEQPQHDWPSERVETWMREHEPYMDRVMEFMADAAKDIAGELLAATSEDCRYTIEFDVDGNYSLDKLAKELMAIVKDPESRILIDPRGPAGGNTNVQVYVASVEDSTAVKQYKQEPMLSVHSIVE